MTPRLYSLDEVDPNWASRWTLGQSMVLPVPTVYLHHTVTVPTHDVLRDAAAVNDIDQQRFGKISYSWNVHGLTGEWFEAETTHRGAHTINNANQSLNGISFGVGVIGNFHPNVPGVPTNDVTEALLDSIAEGIDAFVLPHLTDPFHLFGHRDVYSTACCGDLLYSRLDDIRARLGHPPPPPPSGDPDVQRGHYCIKSGEIQVKIAGRNMIRPIPVGPGGYAQARADALDAGVTLDENPPGWAGTKSITDAKGETKVVWTISATDAPQFGL
jgi:hypothetical protein